jgi:hypothetical protein
MEKYLVLNWAARREDVWRSGGIAHAFLTLALDGSEWSDSRFGRFIPDTHQIGDWVDPRAGRDAVALKRMLE